MSRLPCTAFVAVVLACSCAVASAQQAPLYVHAPQTARRAASAILTLPNVPSNKSWYANWIMFVGESPAIGHQMFVQIGMIRRPEDDPRLHVFVAWQGADGAAGIEYHQYGHLTEGKHRFSIAQDGDLFTLVADGAPVARVFFVPLARAERAYFEIGPEVYAQGDALSGQILQASWRTSAGWEAAADSQLCRYENHGVFLRYEHGHWAAHGRFDPAQPSAFGGSCRMI